MHESLNEGWVTADGWLKEKNEKKEIHGLPILDINAAVYSDGFQTARLFGIVGRVYL